MSDSFTLIIIYGNLRQGKSAYALKALQQALEYLYGYPKLTPDLVREYMGWEPNEVFEQWLMLEERQPVYIWDDAGYWLHSMNWHDDLMIHIQQYFNVIGSDYNTVIMTTPSPDWILSKIANMPGMVRVKIVKRDGGISDAPSKRFSRLAVAYRPWISPDLKKRGVNKIWKDEYNCKIWDDLYAWYKPVRDTYNKMAKIAILNAWRKKKQRDELEDLSLNKKIRTLEKEMFEGSQKINGKGKKQLGRNIGDELEP